MGLAPILAFSTISYQAVAHDPDAKAASMMGTPENTLEAYRSAIESLDDTIMPRLFTDDALVFEKGKAEGSFGNYLAHHLSPELKEFESFTFSNVATEMSVLGETAIASETYTYTIVLKDGRTIERQGVATAVLVKRDESWKIAQYHSSSRTPK
ncbi:MAG: nuclear transport factor 2 family protein [Pontixanthobacter sp.]